MAAADVPKLSPGMTAHVFSSRPKRNANSAPLIPRRANIQQSQHFRALGGVARTTCWPFQRTQHNLAPPLEGPGNRGLKHVRLVANWQSACVLNEARHAVVVWVARFGQDARSPAQAPHHSKGAIGSSRGSWTASRTTKRLRSAIPGAGWRGLILGPSRLGCHKPVGDQPRGAWCKPARSRSKVSRP